jgi:hypothetical protein
MMTVAAFVMHNLRVHTGAVCGNELACKSPTDVHGVLVRWYFKVVIVLCASVLDCSQSRVRLPMHINRANVFFVRLV